MRWKEATSSHSAAGRARFAARLASWVGRGRLGVLALVTGGFMGGAVSADEPAPTVPGPGISLDRLLTLPDSYSPTLERRGKATENEWRERFRLARIELQVAKDALAESTAELEELGRGTESWKLAPPGAPAGGSGGPLSYELRQRIDRQRAEVDRATRALRDLEIEANLAGVPEHWRSDPTKAEVDT